LDAARSITDLGLGLNSSMPDGIGSPIAFHEPWSPSVNCKVGRVFAFAHYYDGAVDEGWIGHVHRGRPHRYIEKLSQGVRAKSCFFALNP
jgi:hypothetical protein